jgi:lysophospholipase L1-like esterase
MKRASGFALLLIVGNLTTLAGDSFVQAQDERRANPDPQRFAAEIRAFDTWDRKNSVPRDAILFVGSSSIRLWPTAQSFPDLTVVNRGFGGSHISDVIHFADQAAFKYQPRTIVFYAGDNDLADGKSPQQVADDFQSFVKRVHERLPNARIYFLSIKPSVARWRLWPKMQEANGLIQKMADADERLDVIDVSPPLLDENGQPRADMLVGDGLHLNEEGYRAWTRIVAPILSAKQAAR